MKKTFLAKRNALLSSNDLSWGAWALAVVLVILVLRLVAPNFFLKLFSPLFHGADLAAVGSHTFFSSFGNASALTLQNEKLQEENAALAAENAALIQKEASLTPLVGAAALAKSSASEILAGVVARPPESPYDTLVVAEGSDVGVTLGMEAFAAEGTPIGVVSSVLADFSRVTLFSSSHMTTVGSVGQLNTPLTITGSGAGALSASVARAANVAVGDTVFVPGPGALPIGSVVRIDSDPSSPSVTLQIQGAVNLFSESWLTLRDTGSALLKALPQATSTLP